MIFYINGRKGQLLTSQLLYQLSHSSIKDYYKGKLYNLQDIFLQDRKFALLLHFS